MSRYADKFEAYDITGGIYNTRKLPKWRFNQVEVMDYMSLLEDESFGSLDPGLAAS